MEPQKAVLICSLTVTIFGSRWIRNQTALETARLLLSMYQPLFAYLTEGKKNPKYLIKSIEICSHHVQDAQEGGGTPPTDPGTRGKNPAELSSETQDAASLTASEVSYLLTLLGTKLRSSL